jgi:hypothetical protein
VRKFPGTQARAEVEGPFYFLTSQYHAQLRRRGKKNSEINIKIGGQDSAYALFAARVTRSDILSSGSVYYEGESERSRAGYDRREYVFMVIIVAV